MVGILTERIETNRALDRFGTDVIPSTTNEVLNATLEDAFVRNPTPSLFREIRRTRENVAGIIGETSGDETAPRLMEPDEANQRFGIEGKLTFDAATTEGVAEELNRLKREELQREDVFRRAQGGVGQWTARLGVGLAASALDPLNLASAFIPVVGPSRYALWLEGAGSALARAGVRARVGAVEGLAGAAVLEPLVYGVAKSEQADYTAADSMLNLAFGTVLGGGLHAGFGAIGDRITGGFARQIEDMSTETRETALRTAIANVAEGRPVRIDPILELERARLGEAYDAVRDSPIGPADDPMVRLRPSDIDEILVQRGVAVERAGEIVIPGRGYALVKFIFKDGEGSSRAPDAQITRADVLAFPDVIRRFEPAESVGTPNQEGYRRAWRVEQNGRNIVYAVTRWNDADRAVTMFVDKKGGVMSREIPPGSRTGIMTPDADTASGLPSQLGRSRAAEPSLGERQAVGNSIRQAAEISHRIDGRSGDGIDDVRAAQSIPPAPKVVTPEIARQNTVNDVENAVQAVDQAIAEAKTAGRLSEGDIKTLSDADELIKRADALDRVAKSAAACMGNS